MQPSELRNQFLDFLQQRCSGTPHEKLGVEYEAFALLPDHPEGWQSLPIAGEQSVRALLEQMEVLSQESPRPWQLQFEGDLLLGLLHQSGQSISIEPGGQVELSDAPRSDLMEVSQALQWHLQELEQALSPWSGRMLFLGAHPFCTPDELPLLEKKRYQIMYATMAEVDTHGRWMMKATSGVQVNVDYQSLEDLERKFVLLNRLTPFLNAIFANSPIVGKKPSGYRSFRGRIWQNTDPYRAGLPQSFVSHRFHLPDYIEWALDARPYHLYRGGELFLPGPYTFRQLLQQQNDLELTQEDWMLHLGMLFPEVRIKRIMEIRCIDTQQPRDVMAVPALIQTLSYNEAALSQLESWLLDLPEDIFTPCRLAASQDGLSAEVGGVRFAEAALRIMEAVLGHMDSSTQAPWLQPFFDRYTKYGKSPADLVLERFHRASSFDSWLAQEVELHHVTTLN